LHPDRQAAHLFVNGDGAAVGVGVSSDTRQRVRRARLADHEYRIGGSGHGHRCWNVQRGGERQRASAHSLADGAFSTNGDHRKRADTHECGSAYGNAAATDRNVCAAPANRNTCAAPADRNVCAAGESNFSAIAHRDTCSTLAHCNTRSTLAHCNTRSALAHRDACSALAHGRSALAHRAASHRGSTVANNAAIAHCRSAVADGNSRPRRAGESSIGNGRPADCNGHPADTNGRPTDTNRNGVADRCSTLADKGARATSYRDANRRGGYAGNRDIEPAAGHPNG
jgi:hypothetical protein